jgi:hypothetical protein
MLRYHIAYHLPRSAGEMVVAEALDFPGAVSQGFDFADARLMIASAMEDLARTSHTDRGGGGFRRGVKRFGPGDAATRAGALDAGPEPAARMVFFGRETIFAQTMAQFAHGSTWPGKA